MRLLLFIIFISCISASVHAVMIKQLVVNGSTKTKNKAIERWAQIKIGQEISEEEYQLAIENLRRAYQFNLKSVRLENEILYVEIEDKWSLFPVPMINQSGNYYSRGMLLYENNFLGNLGTFAPGVFWTNSGMNGLIYFQQDNVIAPFWGMKLILLHKSDLTEYERREKVLDAFESRLDTVILTPNFHKGRHDQKLGPIYTKKEVFREGGSEPVFTAERFGLYYRHHYNHFKKLPVLFDGLVTSYDMFYLQDQKGGGDYLHGGDIQYCQPVGNHFVMGQVHYFHTDNSGYLSPKMLGGNEGHRGYDRESLPAKSNAGLMLQNQLNLTGRFYASPFYEYNYSKLIAPVQNGETLSDSTVGLNFSYYFEKVSIPAVILEYARNLDDHSNHVHINVGLKL